MKKLMLLLCLAVTAVVSTAPVFAAESSEPDTKPVIEPQIDRRDVHVPKIRSSDIEIGAYAGILSIQDFGAKSSSGWRLGYHVTEDLFLEGNYGRSTISDQSYYNLGAAIFTSRILKLTYYNLSVGYNLFPGEVFIGKDWAMTSAVYVVGGIGNFNFANENHASFNFGFGIRVLPVDWLSLRLEVRDHLFQSDILGKNELKHNFDMTLGLAGYF